MGLESPMESGERLESGERQKLLDEKLGHENQRQVAINKENSIRSRYGADVNSEDAQREIAEAQREQAVAQRMIDGVDQRLRTAK